MVFSGELATKLAVAGVHHSNPIPITHDNARINGYAGTRIIFLTPQWSVGGQPIKACTSCVF